MFQYQGEGKVATEEMEEKSENVYFGRWLLGCYWELRE
jgi:hypothetical protein